MRLLPATLSLLSLLPGGLAAQQPRAARIADVRYEVGFTRELARRRRMDVTMTFDVAGSGPVLLSLPVWTPGAYEVTDFARWVYGFGATRDGAPVAWDKVDPDTWRLKAPGPGRVAVHFELKADSLDNAMAWSRDDFLLFNGTNAFLYPEGQGFDFPATVTIRTEDDWLVATGMTRTGPRTYREGNYHDLVDMPFFVGRFDYDSVASQGTTIRLATYPAGSLAGDARTATLEALRTMYPPMVAAFGDAPFRHYDVMQLTDTSFQGASGLEHQNSHVDVITPNAVGNPFLNWLFSHEMVHAWNVKRLRPSDLWPYRYDRAQPTPWLWVSEGITDYYADLVLVRSGLAQPAQFWATQQGKMQEVAGAPPVALEDASLSTWIHPGDGTGYLYYPKGSLAGLMLDILIRDASDNAKSLDDVMRGLYRSTYQRGRGFTADEWWKAVSAAAGGKPFREFEAKYIDGREPFPWAAVLPLAGMREVREPRVGVQTGTDSVRSVVERVLPGGAGAQAGLQAGDEIVKVGDVEVRPPEDWSPAFRARYAGAEGQSVQLVIRRDGELKTLTMPIVLAATRIEEDPGATGKALRIRNSIVTGK
jgi:predicted metalloprotease with PDZ domain